MAIQVYNIADPPVGHDWSETVVGQYTWRIIAAYATLTPGSGLPVVMHDTSGNNYDGIYGAPTIMDFNAGQVPGFVGTDGAYRFTNDIPFSAPGEISAGLFPGGPFDFSGDYSLMFWAQMNDSFVSGRILTGGGSPAQGFRFSLLNFDLPKWVARFEWAFAPGPVQGELDYDAAFDATMPHLYAIVVNGDNASLYIDGVLTVPTGYTSQPPSGNAGALVNLADGVNAIFPHSPQVTLDELAVFSTVLSGADIAGVYALRADFDLYRAEVLGLNPVGYYHLDDVAGSSGRAVTFKATNGLRTVFDIAPPDPQAGANPLSYTWLPGVTNDQTTIDGGITVVGIPDVVLPPGYVFGTRTLDLDPADQWSNIAVWVDQQYTNDVGGQVPYLDAILLG